MTRRRDVGPGEHPQPFGPPDHLPHDPASAAPARFPALPGIGADRAARFIAGLQRGAGNAAVTRWLSTARPTVAREAKTPSPTARRLARSRWRPIAEIESEIAEATQRRAAANSGAQDVIEQASDHRPPAPRRGVPDPDARRGRGLRRRGPSWREQLRSGLEDVMGDDALPDALRKQAQTALGNLDEIESDLERLWRERNHPHHPSNVQQHSSSTKPAKATNTKSSTPTDPPKAASKPPQKPPSTAAKPPSTVPKSATTTGAGARPKPPPLGSVTTLVTCRP